MFTRKHLKRFRRYLVLAAVALVINVVFPTKAHAQSAVPSSVVDISNAVTVEQPTIEQPTVPLSTLPTPSEKPEPPVSKTMAVRATAYSSTVDQCDGDPFTTANGTKVRDGIIAMNGVKFGTKVRIPSHYGTKVFTVTDRMNAKWGNKRIDIWMPTRDAAKQWGIRTVTIEILS